MAGVEVASLYGTLKLENTASGALKQFKGDMGEAHGGLMDIAKGALGLGGILTAALGGIGFGAMIHEAAEAEKGMAQLNAVLKSTHGVAGVTADKAVDLANSLSKVTTYSDDAILGAENILLTFTNIKADVFPGVTEMALNMSQALGQDVKSSAMQLGKALNDPINGATALKRVGVALSDQQIAQIRYYQQTNQLAKAQAVIMAELTTEFGGSARAIGDTFGGKLEIAKNAFSNLLETVGGMLLPVLTPVLTTLTSIFSGVSDGIGGFFNSLKGMNIDGALEQIFGVGYDLVDKFLAALGFSDDSRSKIIGFIAEFGNQISDFIGNVLKNIFPTQHGAMSGMEEKVFGKDKEPAPLIDRIKAALGITPELETSISTIFDGIKTALSDAFKPFTDAIGAKLDTLTETDTPFIDRIKKVLGITPETETLITNVIGKVGEVLTPILDNIKKGVGEFITSFQGVDWSGFEKIGQTLDILRIAFMGVAGVIVGGALAGISGVIGPIGKTIAALADGLSALANGNMDRVGEDIKKFIEGLGGIVLGPAKAIADFIGQIIGINIDDGLKPWKDIAEQLPGILTSLFAADGPIAKAIAPITETWNGIFGEKGSLKVGIENVKTWIDDFIKKIGEIASAISGAFGNVVKTMVGPFKDAMHRLGELLHNVGWVAGINIGAIGDSLISAADNIKLADKGGRVYKGEPVGVGAGAGAYEVFVPGFNGGAFPQSMMGSGGGNVTVVINGANMSGRDIINSVNRELRMNNKPPLGASAD